MWIGIDPGKRGGIVAISEEGLVKAVPLNQCLFKGKWSNERLSKTIRDFVELNPTRIVIERQHAMPRQGVSSMFTIGYGFGLLVGGFSQIGIAPVVVMAKRWQQEILADQEGEGKEKAIRLAYSMYPALRELSRAEHTGLTDAACIAMYAKQMREEDVEERSSRKRKRKRRVRRTSRKVHKA